VVVSYGSPYLIRQFPKVPAYVCALRGAESSQRAAIAGAAGGEARYGPPAGHDPGSLPEGARNDAAKHEMRLRTARPEDVGFRAGAMPEVDAVLDRFLSEKAFRAASSRSARTARSFICGHSAGSAYDSSAPTVEAPTIYDLASLTKVIATTTMAMILVDEGKLSLDKRVRDFILPSTEVTRTR